MASTSRHRERETPETFGYLVCTYTGSINRVDTYGPFNEDYEAETIDDVVTPNYHNLIAQGAIINNPCNYDYHIREKIGNGSMQVDYPAAGWTMVGEGDVSAHYAMVDAQWDAYVPKQTLYASEERAKQLALANIDSTPYAFGEDALELRETIRFLKSPLKSLFDLTTTMKKHKASIKRKDLKAGRITKMYADNLSDIWLQYRFAASPLIRSVADALDAYSSLPPSLPERLTARGKSKDDYLVTADNVPQGGVYDPYLFFHLERGEMLDWHASILYTVSNPVYDWRYRLGFRVKDVPTTIWQVMPYSFMVDRVLDVTSFSKGVLNLADPNVKILAASSRRKYEIVQSYKLSHMVNGGGVNRSGQGETHREKHYSYDRTPWSPSIKDTVPQLTLRNLVDDATKIADLAALIYQRVK